MHTLGGGFVTVCFILNVGVLFAEDVGTSASSTKSNIKQGSRSHLHQLSSYDPSNKSTTISSTKPLSTFERKLIKNSTSSISTTTSTSHSTSVTTPVPSTTNSSLYSSPSVPTNLTTSVSSSTSSLSVSSSTPFSVSTKAVSSSSSSSPLPPFSSPPNTNKSSKRTMSAFTVSSSKHNVTIPGVKSSTSDTSESTTVSANISSTNVPESGEHSGLHISTETAIGIFLVILVLVVVGSIVTYILKKKGNLPFHCCKSCFPGRRRRRSSTSSRGPLTQDDATFVNITDAPPRQDRELFSIGDQDGGQDGRQRAMQRRGTEDDYFYDEIFGQSAFVDETTNRANTYLSVADEDDDDDILAGLNIPDLVFKKPNKM